MECNFGQYFDVWPIHSSSRIVSFVAPPPAVFLSVAIINLAKKQADCETEKPEGELKVPECDARVYGLKPSSLLTTKRGKIEKER